MCMYIYILMHIHNIFQRYMLEEGFYSADAPSSFYGDVRAWLVGWLGGLKSMFALTTTRFKFLDFGGFALT